MATFQFGLGVPPKRIKLDIADLGGTEVILGGRFFKDGKIVMDWDKNELEFPSHTVLNLLGNDLEGELRDIEDEWAVGRARALRTDSVHLDRILGQRGLWDITRVHYYETKRQAVFSCFAQY
jgi:hypothetical protein